MQLEIPRGSANSIDELDSDLGKIDGIPTRFELCQVVDSCQEPKRYIRRPIAIMPKEAQGLLRLLYLLYASQKTRREYGWILVEIRLF